MADFTLKGTVDGSEPIQFEFDVAAGAAGTIVAGDIIEVANGYAALSANGGMAAGNIFSALAVSTSTDTAGAAGKVIALFSPAGLIVQGTATTPAQLVIGVVFDKVSLDVANGVQTVDEDAAGAMTIWSIDSDSTTTGLCRVVLPWSFAS